MSLSLLPILHSKQLVTRFSNVVFPPFEKGIIWSMTNLAPSLGVLPQYRHAKLSLSNIVNRIFKWDFLDTLKQRRWERGLEGRCEQGQLGLAEPHFIGGNPAFFIALPKVPKWLRYAPTDGNPDNFFGVPVVQKLFLQGLWPNNSEASINLDKRYSSVKPFFVFILLCIKGLLK